MAERLRRIARWGEVKLTRRSRRVQGVLGAALRLLPMAQRSMVFAPSNAASQVMSAPLACVGSMLPYPSSGGRLVLTALQACNRAGNPRVRIKRDYVQIGPNILLNERVKTTKQRRVTGSVVYCGGPSQGNWHHWLLEVLPSAFHAARGAEVTILIPNSVRASPTRLDTVRNLFSGRDVQFVATDELVVADCVRISGWWLSFPVPNSVQQTALDRELAQQFISALTRSLKSQQGHGNRIYLARGHESRRPYNEVECLDVAVENGFVPVNTRAMTFEEQVATFAEADSIVGPSGAALANLLFARPGAQAVVIGRQTGFTHWDRVADLRSLSVTGLPWSQLRDGSDRREVDVSELQNAIRGLV